MVTSSEDGTVKIWETRSGSIQRSYNHNSPANDVVIHPNQGEIISCDRAGYVKVWDLAENTCTHNMMPEEDVAVSSVTVASDGSLLCAANTKVGAYLVKWFEGGTLTKKPPKQGNVFVWKLLQSFENTKLRPLMQFSAHKEYITRILLSPDVKKLATCSADHTAKIWEVRELDLPPRRSTQRRTNGTNGAHGGNALRSQSANDAKGLPPTINEDEEGDEDEDDDDVDPSVFPPPFPGPTPNGAPSGGFSMHGMSAFNTPTQQQMDPQQQQQAARLMYPWPLEATLTGHQRWVWDCAFSADSAYLVTACSDHYARLWELHSQQIIRQYNGHHRGAVCVALNDYSETR